MKRALEQIPFSPTKRATSPCRENQPWTPESTNGWAGRGLLPPSKAQPLTGSECHCPAPHVTWGTCAGSPGDAQSMGDAGISLPAHSFATGQGTVPTRNLLLLPLRCHDGVTHRCGCRSCRCDRGSSDLSDAKCRGTLQSLGPPSPFHRCPERSSPARSPSASWHRSEHLTGQTTSGLIIHPALRAGLRRVTARLCAS